MASIRICKDCGLVVVGKGLSFCATCKQEREKRQNCGDHTYRLPKYKTPDMCYWGKCMTIRTEGSTWYCDEHNKQQTDRFRHKRHRAMTDERLTKHIATTERLLEELRWEFERRGLDVKSID